jgi:predicted lipoprotein with Yx(FWY)xxD motif
VKLKLVLVGALMLTLAACGGSGNTTTTAGQTTTTGATSTTAATTTTTAPAETTTTEAMTTTTESMTTSTSAGSADTLGFRSTDLGDILVDGSGYTLYLFEPDAQSDSTCYNSCESTWPPLAGEASAGIGVEPALIASVSRTDGSQQVTYNDWPLYRYSGDTAPGDTNGQGLNGSWYVVSPTGEAIGNG